MGVILVLGLGVRTSCRRIGISHGNVEIGYEFLDCSWTYPNADNTPGGITKGDAGGIYVVVEMYTDPNP